MPEEGGFFEVMKDAISAIAPGLENFGAEVGAELGRMGTQGAAELASALFGESNAYVAYGAGQQPVEVEAPQMEAAVQAVEAPQVQAAQAVEAPQQERGGMEM